MPGDQALKLVVLEGTCGAGKTTLWRGAAEQAPQVWAIPQRTTYGPIAAHEDAGTLDDATNLRMLRAIVAQIRAELVGDRLVIVDTLHATHFVRAGALSLASFVAIDGELASLDPLVVVLQVSAPAIRARAVEARRGTGFDTYARKFGSSDDARTAYFVREQERLLTVLDRHSRLRRVVLDGDEPADAVHARFVELVRGEDQRGAR